MWLLDVNMPKKLEAVPGGLGIHAECADYRGWGGLTDGTLVEAAVQAGFRCVLTRNRLFSESASGALKRFPTFCVVLVTIPQLRGPEFLTHFQSAWERSPVQPVEGELMRWPAD
jgi:hypothetical protein